MSIRLFELIQGHIADCLKNSNCLGVRFDKSPVFSDLMTVSVRWNPGKLDDIELIMFIIASDWALDWEDDDGDIIIHLGFNGLS